MAGYLLKSNPKLFILAISLSLICTFEIPRALGRIDKIELSRPYVPNALIIFGIPLIFYPLLKNIKRVYFLGIFSIFLGIFGNQEISLRFSEKILKQKYIVKARELGLDKQKTFEEDGFFPCEHKKDQRIVRRLIQSDPAYAGMIENLDYNIGRVLKALDDCGKMENTVIFFTSDNGGLSTAEGSPTCNFPLSEGKGWMYEGGVREPLIIKWQDVIEPDSICDVPITSTDFYPTILEMAGLSLMHEQHCDGVSFLPVLTGSGKIEREAIFWHYPHYGNQGGTPSASVRSGNYKLIEFFEDEHLELYDLNEDISEKNNIANDCPNVTKMLKEMLKEWQNQVSAKIPERNPNYTL